MKKVLITDAYSASNLGDAELVLQTLKVVKRRGPTRAHVQAVDTASFAAILLDGETIGEKLFPRLDYLSASKRARMLVVAKWGIQAIFWTAVCLLPGEQNRRRVLMAAGTRTLKRMLEHESAVAVGGGYLGDQYWKDSLLTAFSWWLLIRSGIPVETMPLSVEFSAGWKGHLWAQLVKRVKFRARDRASVGVLQSLGLRAEELPDLAFYNAGTRRPQSSPRVSLAIALVGRDYLTAEQVEDLVYAVSAGCRSVGVFHVGVISMHRSIQGTDVGCDDAASDRLRAGLDAEGIVATSISVRNYRELCMEVQGYTAVVSARMHAGIAGLCADIPVGLLAYENKHTAMFADMGLSEVVVPITAPLDVIEALLARLIASRSRGNFIGGRVARERRRLLEKHVG